MSNPKVESNRGHGTKGGQFGFARDVADEAIAADRAGALADVDHYDGWVDELCDDCDKEQFECECESDFVSPEHHKPLSEQPLLCFECAQPVDECVCGSEDVDLPADLVTRSPGVPIDSTGFVVGGGGTGLTAELNEAVDTAAATLAQRFNYPVTIRYNSDRRSGGAWLREHDTDRIGVNSFVGVNFDILHRDDDTDSEIACSTSIHPLAARTRPDDLTWAAGETHADGNAAVDHLVEHAVSGEELAARYKLVEDDHNAHVDARISSLRDELSAKSLPEIESWRVSRGVADVQFRHRRDGKMRKAEVIDALAAEAFRPQDRQFNQPIERIQPRNYWAIVGD